MTMDNEQMRYIRIVTLKGALSLQAKGMRHSKFSGRDLLNMAETLTGQKFANRQYRQAADALDGAAKLMLAKRSAANA